MTALGYVLEDVLKSIIPLFFVFIVKFHEICYIGGYPYDYSIVAKLATMENVLRETLHGSSFNNI